MAGSEKLVQKVVAFDKLAVHSALFGACDVVVSCLSESEGRDETMKVALHVR